MILIEMLKGHGKNSDVDMNHQSGCDMDNIYSFLIELDKLKNVTRRSYVSDLVRNENSAEHSWHLAMGVLTLKEELKIEFDIVRALKMALVHDVCEIGAGDISIYDPERSKNEIKEREYIGKLATAPIVFALEIEQLWEEYEAQSTVESRWVKVVDRLLPFMMNLNTSGKAWIEQGVSKSQVKEINQHIAKEVPEVYEWMLIQIDAAIEKGWLKNE